MRALLSLLLVAVLVAPPCTYTSLPWLLARPASAQTAEADVFVARAILAFEEKRYDEALAAIQEALKLDPVHVDALYYLGLIQITQGRAEEAIAPLEQARGRDPKDEAIAYQLGVAYFSLKRYEQAQPLLEQVFRIRPRLDSLGYYVGFMRYRQKKYREALEAFRAGSATHPEIQQLTRFYTGLALGVLGLATEAAAEIEAAIRLQPASPLTGPAERLRDAVIASKKAERRFSAEVRVGAFYDSNVSVNPDSSDQDPIVEALRHRKQRSVGEIGALRLEYPFLTLGGLEFAGSYSFFTTYANELPDFNVINHVGGLGATYRGALADRRYQAGLQYTYDYLVLNDREFSQRSTVAPVASLELNDWNLSSLQLRWQKKQFAADRNTPREDLRDGNNYMGGLTHLFLFQGGAHFLKFGYQWDFEDTEGPNSRGTNQSYFGHRALAGAAYTVPWRGLGLRLKYDFDVHVRNFRHRNTLLPPLAPGTKERLDREFTHVAGFTIPIPYRPKIGDRETTFTLATDYQWTIARSNIDVFQFHRNVISVFLVWTY